MCVLPARSQAVQLASCQGGASSKTSPPGELTPLPLEDMRPAGPLVLAGQLPRCGWWLARDTAAVCVLGRRSARVGVAVGQRGRCTLCHLSVLIPCPAERLLLRCLGPVASFSQPLDPLSPLARRAHAGVRHSYLWLADALGRPFTLSLRHPGIRLRSLAARGELSTARTIAQRGAGGELLLPGLAAAA